MPGEFTPTEAREFYDRFGSKQDYQAFYEDRATTELLRHARLESAKAVFEFGCGTGRFARKVLSSYLPPNTSYTGVDISPKMVGLTRQHLGKWPSQGQVQLITDPDSPLLPADGSIDRFISNYVLDLLSPEYTGSLIREAHRALSEGGLLCLVSLTYGSTPLSKFLSGVWGKLYSLGPQLVGGCHPVNLLDYLPADKWSLRYYQVVIAYGIPSQVVIAVRL